MYLNPINSAVDERKKEGASLLTMAPERGAPALPRRREGFSYNIQYSPILRLT